MAKKAAVKLKLSSDLIKRFISVFLIVIIAALVLVYYIGGPAALIGAIIMSVGVLFFVVYLAFRGL